MLMPGLQVCLSGCQRFPADLTIDRLHYAACTTCSHLKSTVLQTKKKVGYFLGTSFLALLKVFGAFLSAVCFMYLTTKVLSVSWKIPCKNLGFFRYSTSHFLFYCRQKKIEIITSVRALSVCLSVSSLACLLFRWRFLKNKFKYCYVFIYVCFIYAHIFFDSKDQREATVGEGGGLDKLVWLCAYMFM